MMENYLLTGTLQNRQAAPPALANARWHPIMRWKTDHTNGGFKLGTAADMALGAMVWSLPLKIPKKQR